MTQGDRYPLSLELRDLAAAVRGRLHGIGTTRVRGLTHDSRKVLPGMLFCALPGLEKDGLSFVAEARAKGAAAVLAQGRPSPEAHPDVSWVEAADARRAMALAAHRFFGDPSADVRVLGITGTNGKTTTAFLTAAVLEEALGSAAALGTLGLRQGERVRPTGFTTPEAPELAELIRQLATEDVRALAMEVSSHALSQGRVEGLRFAAGIFTNLTHEHLDYHGSLEAYREAKLLLFDRLREADAWGIVNLDDPSAGFFLRRAPRRALTYAQEHPDADVHAEEVELGPGGSRVRVKAGPERVDLRVALGGRFNVSNALAALTAGLAHDLPPRRAAEAIARVERVPGRFELFQGAGRSLLVDYAHTPDAFERVLDTARQLTAGRLALVFGCGGERDRDKRPLMGEIAGRMADEVYLTTDNPRRESPARIVEDVARGLRRANASWIQVDDRREAVRRALERSRPGDLIALLGKGDEGYQEIDGVKHPYSDRRTGSRELAALAEREARAATHG